MRFLRRIGKRIDQVLEDLAALGPRLAFARGRWAHFHDLAARAHDQSVEAGEKADQVRAKQPKRARAHDRKANRKRRRSRNAAAKAQEWVGRVKVLVQQKQKLKHTKEELEDEAARWKRKHGVSIEGNKATGGSPRERLGAVSAASAAACASGKRANFYSQAGAYDVDHCITGEPRGHRSDCSSWFASVYKSCGLPDPSDQSYRGGYTGTLIANGESVSREYARNNPGCSVIWGTGAGHHVEMSKGDGSEGTRGHGSAPIDEGSFSMLPGPVRFYKYELN